MNEIECAWVAGLLEGEGCFTFGPDSNRTKSTACRAMRITCSMTDLDTVQKLHRTVDIGNVCPESRLDKRRAHAKPLYVWSAGKRADVVWLMTLIRPHMSTRRGARIDELLHYAENHPIVYKKPVVCGTRRSYRLGCKCALCKAAMAEYHRDLNKRKREGTYVPKARKDYNSPV